MTGSSCSGRVQLPVRFAPDVGGRSGSTSAGSTKALGPPLSRALSCARRGRMRSLFGRMPARAAPRNGSSRSQGGHSVRLGKGVEEVALMGRRAIWLGASSPAPARTISSPMGSSSWIIFGTRDRPDVVVMAGHCASFLAAFDLPVWFTFDQQFSESSGLIPATAIPRPDFSPSGNALDVGGVDSDERACAERRQRLAGGKGMNVTTAPTWVCAKSGCPLTGNDGGGAGRACASAAGR
jgi:hypothetical protein